MRIKEKIKGDDNKRKAFTYLTETKGLAPHIAAGILGNFMQESGHSLDTEAYNPDDMGSPSAGLAQWRGERLSKLRSKMGEKSSTLEGQLDFMMWEFDNTEKRAYKKLQEASTTKEAALAFSKYYERPHKDYAHNEKRVNYASNVYNTYSGAPEQNTIENVQIAKSEAYAPKQEFEMPDYTLNAPTSTVQVPYLAPYGEEQDTAEISSSPILDEAISKIDRRKTDMATLQKIMKANEVQYIDPNEPVVPEPNSYGYPNMQKGGEVAKELEKYIEEENKINKKRGRKTNKQVTKLQKGDTVKKYEPQSFLGKAYDVLSNPMTALESLTKTGSIPDNLDAAVRSGTADRNNLDMAVDVVNPVAIARNVANVPNDIKEGNYWTAGFNSLDVLPMGYAVKSGIKSGIPKAMGNIIGEGVEQLGKKVKTYKNNFQDLSELNNFSKQYNYNKTNKILNSLSNKTTDDAFIKTLGQHNTFARGISTNWTQLEMRNPNLFKILEESGINYKAEPQKAAEYMATHIPKTNTGYGRMGLEGIENTKDGLYASNSFKTAEGYTYGNGYVAKVQRPLDFKGTRKDWIKNNDIVNYDLNDYVPGSKNNLIKQSYGSGVDSFEQKQISNKVYKLLNKNKEYSSNLDELETVLTSRDKSLANMNYTLQETGTIGDIYKNKGLKGVKEYLKKHLDDGIEWEKTMKNPNDNGILNTKENAAAIKESINDRTRMLENFNDVEFEKFMKASIKSDNIYKTLSDIDEKVANSLITKPYNHYIFTGEKGKKIFDIKDIRKVSPDNYLNSSRAHRGDYSEGLSKLTLGGGIYQSEKNNTKRGRKIKKNGKKR